MAARVCIAEVEEIVPAGGLDPNEIHLPGIFVHRLIQGPSYEKRIERLTVDKDEGGGRHRKTGSWPYSHCQACCERVQMACTSILALGFLHLRPTFFQMASKSNFKARMAFSAWVHTPKEGHVDPDADQCGKRRL